MKTLLLSLFLSISTFANVDISKSTFKWTGSKITEGHFGNVNLKSGSVTLNEGKITAGTFVMDLKTLSVGDITGEYATKLTNHLKSGDFLEVDKYPTATLEVMSVEGNKVSANLTIKGKTQPVDFIVDQKENIMTGVLKFNRTKFGIIYNSGNFFKDLGDKLIKDEVTLDFSVQLKS